MTSFQQSWFPARPAADRLVRRARGVAASLCVAVAVAGPVGTTRPVGEVRADEYTLEADDDDGDLARKSDIMHGPRWQRTIAEFGTWLTTQTIYSPAEVRRIKSQFNGRVAAMSSYEIEYLLESLGAKLELLDSPEARDAKAWLGSYLSAMSDARRAAELRKIPNLLDMNAAQLAQQIQRVDALRSTLQQRQQGVEARQAVLAERASAGRRATASASQAAAARPRSAPAHSPYRQGGGSPPFADVQRRQPLIPIGMFGGFVGF
ncbi:MAG: hypothetical protein ACK6CT_15745 [Planctomycetia bacterium]|jgi:hypothetical protein